MVGKKFTDAAPKPKGSHVEAVIPNRDLTTREFKAVYRFLDNSFFVRLGDFPNMEQLDEAQQRKIFDAMYNVRLHLTTDDYSFENGMIQPFNMPDTINELHAVIDAAVNPSQKFGSEYAKIAPKDRKFVADYLKQKVDMIISGLGESAVRSA